MSELEGFEKATLILVNRVLAEKAECLQELLLTPELQELAYTDRGTPMHSSEVTIYFWDSTALAEKRRDLVDVIEFHAVQKGKPEASLEETEVWMRSVLKDVCDRRQRKL